jgi:hypothetical protein
MTEAPLKIFFASFASPLRLKAFCPDCSANSAVKIFLPRLLRELCG